jgi:segregation and condensation protein B
MSSLSSQIEAVLYLKAGAVDLETIAMTIGCDREEIVPGIIELINDYAHRETALEIVEDDRGYVLQLREEFRQLMEKTIPAQIGMGALRTLAAIALKGKIAQNELVELRGSGAYEHVKELVEIGLVSKKRQSGNRSSLLQVTSKFHQTYEVDKIPGMEPLIRAIVRQNKDSENDLEDDGDLEPSIVAIDIDSPEMEE